MCLPLPWVVLRPPSVIYLVYQGKSIRYHFNGQFTLLISNVFYYPFLFLI